ncbi:MAG TPA: LytR C-terminal domain-containing protein [Nocardioidaceae bacterium]|nr:LytR C-terminal domain-containing protein [Nocardioidaceae bacterium]
MLGLPSPRFDTPTQSRSHRGPRDQRGFVMSSPLALMSAGAILLAGASYVATSPTEKVEVHLAVKPQVIEPKVTFEKVKVIPAVPRKDTYVVVFNNSGVTGLAGRTAERLSGAGWTVVGSDNWYGTIPASTVYYPASLERQARLVAKDLEIDRIKPAVDPMSMDRVTVILTQDFRLN